MSLVPASHLADSLSSASSEDASDNPSFTGGIAAHASASVRRWSDLSDGERKTMLARAEADRDAVQLEARTSMRGFRAFKAGCSSALWDKHVEACLLFAEQHVGGEAELAPLLDAVRRHAKAKALAEGFRESDTLAALQVSSEERYALAAASALGRPIYDDDGDLDVSAYLEALRDDAKNGDSTQIEEE